MQEHPTLQEEPFHRGAVLLIATMGVFTCFSCSNTASITRTYSYHGNFHLFLGPKYGEHHTNGLLLCVFPPVFRAQLLRQHM